MQNFGAGVGRVPVARAKLINAIARRNDAQFHCLGNGRQYWFSTDIVFPPAIRRTYEDIVAELKTAGLWPIVPGGDR